MSCTPQMLLEAASHVLETAAFMTVEPTAEPGDWRDGLEARLSFGAPLEGTLRVAAPRALAQAVAAGLMGCDPNDPSAVEAARDALGELLNQVAGVLAWRLLGDRQTCPLGIPEVGPAGGAPEAGAGSLGVFLRVEDQYPLFFAAQLQPRTAGAAP
ncbi:MAG: chemotaxis protein CheX [Myxococcales bacterium]